ncbi:MAG TPA: chromate transporter [Azonexus sp.]|nr:chromate transporter [Azonexus sp.]
MTTECSNSEINVAPRPKSLADLFIFFTLLALQGFGGVAAVAQQELVERKRWMTNEEFVEQWSVAQIMPGANIVNLSLMVGGRHFGLPGALAALAGMLAAPLAIVLIIALVYAQYADDPNVIGALRGMVAVAAGMIIATGLRLAGTQKSNPIGVATCLALGISSFTGIALFHWPLPYVLLGLGPLGYFLAYRKLKP